MKAVVSQQVLRTYFAGQATTQQKQHIDEWAKDPSNRELFFGCLAEWESRSMSFKANVYEAIKRHQQRMA